MARRTKNEKVEEARHVLARAKFEKKLNAMGAAYVYALCISQWRVIWRLKRELKRSKGYLEATKELLHRPRSR